MSSAFFIHLCICRILNGMGNKHALRVGHSQRICLRRSGADKFRRSNRNRGRLRISNHTVMQTARSTGTSVSQSLNHKVRYHAEFLRAMQPVQVERSALRSASASRPQLGEPAPVQVDPAHIALGLRNIEQRHPSGDGTMLERGVSCRVTGTRSSGGIQTTVNGNSFRTDTAQAVCQRNGLC